MKGWRTLAWNIANAVVLGMDLALQQQMEIPEAWMPYWLGLYIAGNVVLRLVTTTPVGTK